MSVLDRPAVNIFEILNLRKERYHNAMLTWLLDSALDPRRGLGNTFLVDFLDLCIGSVNLNKQPCSCQST